MTGYPTNPFLKIAVHVKAHPTACTKGYPIFTNCTGIVYAYPGAGDIDVLPVFFDLVACTAVECGLSWPEDSWGSGSWTTCRGDVTVGSIQHSAELTGFDPATQGVSVS